MGSKEGERGRKSKQMTVTGNAEHVTQASFKMRKMERNASGYSVTSAKRHHTLIVYQTFIECFSHLTQTRKMSICVLPAGIWKVK